MAGAPGFEPGIAGPKPAALPLGYAPPTEGLPVHSLPPDSAPPAEQDNEGDDRHNRDRDDCNCGQDEQKDGHQRHEGL